MKKYSFLLLLPLLIYSCKNNSEAVTEKVSANNKRYEKIEALEWLLGTWVNESGEEFSQETWSKENDSTFTAFSFIQIKGETVFAETMALEQKHDSLLLTVAEANKKDAAAVSFRFISSEEKAFVFENKHHDFPQRIIYTQPAKDSLKAWIEGSVNGEMKTTEFHFSRKK